MNTSDWFLTHSNKRIDITNLKERDICLEDIAHHLSNYSCQRFTGALPLGCHYSVAQHSILLADYCYNETQDEKLAAMALLHDASEAYLSDINSMVKKLLPDYQKLEAMVQFIIESKYLSRVEDYIKKKVLISDLDKRMVLDEVWHLMPEKYEFFTEHSPTLNRLNINKIVAFNPYFIKQHFLEKCEEWGIRDE